MALSNTLTAKLAKAQSRIEWLVRCVLDATRERDDAQAAAESAIKAQAAMLATVPEDRLRVTLNSILFPDHNDPNLACEATKLIEIIRDLHTESIARRAGLQAIAKLCGLNDSATTGAILEDLETWIGEALKTEEKAEGLEAWQEEHEGDVPRADVAELLSELGYDGALILPPDAPHTINDIVDTCTIDSLIHSKTRRAA